jgi:4-alpha-glucanotransferase
MNRPPETNRASGILAHITSLPSPFGIGDIGVAAQRFLDYLSSAGQTYWQILPTGPSDEVFDNSPYMSSSAFAGSPLLISPELLISDGLLVEQDIAGLKDVSDFSVNFHAVARFKSQLLTKAFTAFAKNPTDAFAAFQKTTHWLDDYALFMVLKEKFNNKPWYHWPTEFANRHTKSLEETRLKLRPRLTYFAFEQYIFARQWHAMKQHAHHKRVRLIGDIPIYVALDSADVWAHQELFELDKNTGLPLLVAGVPPDYFSKTGQLWGNPIYRWASPETSVQQALTTWWTNRLAAMFSLVDMARIDHFRGFESYWAVPASDKTAEHGSWLKGPGEQLFRQIEKKLGPLPIIAEDLGIITEAVTTLRETLGYPGMKVLQFAFDGHPDNPFLPWNFETSRCVVYTGTHDNDTTLGWFLSENLSENTRSTIKQSANQKITGTSPIHHDLIYLAQSSVAQLSIIPLQDILGFGGDCRMNIPGVATGNWRWRCAQHFLTDELADWFKEITRRFNRL